MEDEHRQDKWKEIVSVGKKAYRPKNKRELKHEKQRNGAILFLLLIIFITAIGFPFIIHWLR